MPIAGTNISLNTAEGEDKITVTEKVTTTYFSNDATELLAANIISESLSDTNEQYYFGVAHSDTPTIPEFHVAYGNLDGKGGNTVSDTIKSPTEVVYKQWASLLLPPTEVSGGFIISRNSGLSTAPSSATIAAGRDGDIYVLTGKRNLMKDRLNKKNWTIALSGSTSATLGAVGAPGLQPLSLTDDSVNDNPVSTPVGDRYNIVSGSDGSVVNEASVKTFGWYYPDIGTMVFSGAELSSSIPGGNAIENSHTVKFDSGSQKGFGINSVETANDKNALRFINCLQPTGCKLKFRDEEDQVSAQYFCRIKSGHMNFSNNPTFVSGSLNELRQTTMKGNPATFISQIQLINSTGDIVAVGNLSTVLKKSYSSEATVKVKLTY